MNDLLFIHIKGDLNWEATATMAAGIFAGLITAAGVLLGLLANAAAVRRQSRVAIYAEAVRAVSAYLEGPYRVARCPNTAELRFALTEDFSSIQGRIDAHLVLVQMTGHGEVFDAYKAYVAAAKREAGKQMTEQWEAPAVRKRSRMNVRVRFEQPESEEARAQLIKLMERDSKPGWRVWRYFF